MEDPILAALTTILGLEPCADGPRWAYVRRATPHDTVWLLCYPGDETLFRTLWCLGVSEGDATPAHKGDEPLLKQLTTVQRVVLVERDNRSVSVGELPKHLRALHWAQAISHALLRQHHAAPRDLATAKLPAIDVLDLSANHDPLDKRRGEVLEDTNLRYFTARPDELDQFCKAIANAPARAVTGDRLYRCFKRWAFEIGDAATREGHHRLNNSIGPLFIAAAIEGNVTRRQVTRPVQSLGETQVHAVLKGALIRAFEWFREPQAATLRNVDLFSGLSQVQRERLGELRLLMLDDQADQGWTHVLTGMLGMAKVSDGQPVRSGFTCVAETRGGHPRVSLWVAVSPDGLLATLEDRISNSDGRLRRLHFTATEQDHGQRINEALLLDLRLFSGNAGRPYDLDSESRFLDQVEDMTRRLRPISTHLAQEPRKPEGIASRLTLLARLVAAIDFTYPVALWSSTGQRASVESVKQYPSIYSGLEKPRFDSYTESVGRFGDAFRNFARWARDSVLSHSDFWGIVDYREEDTWAPPGGSHAYAEIYIDESGDESRSMEVGALVQYYRTEADAETVHDDLGRLQFDAPEPFNSARTLAFHGNLKLPKKLNFEDPELNPIASDKVHADEMRFEVQKRYREILERYDVRSTLVIDKADGSWTYGIRDSRYLYLSTSILRLLLVAFVANKRIRIFVATRFGTTRGRVDRAASVEDAEWLFRRWGVLSQVAFDKRKMQFQAKYTSVENSTVVYPVADALDFSSGIFDGDNSLISAVGVTLSYSQHEPHPAHRVWQLFYDHFKVSGSAGSAYKFANDALAAVFPDIAKGMEPNYRNQHYFADEMIGSSRSTDLCDRYVEVGVLSPKCVFKRKLNGVLNSEDAQIFGTESLKALALNDAPRAFLILSRALHAEWPAVVSAPERDQNMAFLSFVAKRVADALSANLSAAKQAYGTLLCQNRTA